MSEMSQPFSVMVSSETGEYFTREFGKYGRIIGPERIMEYDEKKIK